MVIALLVGYHCPVMLPFAHGTDVMVWFAILMAYCIFASVLPVWLLLRPRDYLSMYILFAVLIVGYIGLFAYHPEISTSPFISSANQLVAALALLTISMWLASTKKPALYTTIPCVIMLTTTIGALIWQIPYNLFYAVPHQPQLSMVGMILLVLAVAVAIESIRTLVRAKLWK